MSAREARRLDGRVEPGHGEGKGENPVSSPASAPQVNITLPDGKVLNFTRGVTGAEVAAAIGPGLAKAALAITVDGKERNIFRPIERDTKIRIITRNDPEPLQLIRHATAHIPSTSAPDPF